MGLPFSEIRQVNNLYYLAGQIGLKGNSLVSDKLEDQLKQAFENIQTILQGNGMDLTNIIDVSAFLVEQTDLAKFNETYSSILNEPYPSRTTVIVKSLPLGAVVEIKAIASK